MPIAPDKFPHLQTPVKGKWAPILLSPILGSPERFVIGIAVVSQTGFHVESANAFKRLECLYGRDSETLIFAANVALDEVKEDIASRGLEALARPNPNFSGIEIGPVREGEANSLEEIARTWLSSMSSLYTNKYELMALAGAKELLVPTDLSIKGPDRLPQLVMDYVTNRRPGLKQFFNEDIREQRVRRRHTKVHGIIIDYSGSKLVANFGTLMVASQATSVDRIKRRMFDLLVERDTERGALAQRKHEMIVQHPTKNDPQITEHQYETVDEAIQALTEQAKHESIGLVPLSAVDAIGDHILQYEQRVAH